MPRREHEIGGDRAEALEEPLAGHQFPRGGSPGAVSQFANRVTGEGQQIEDREHRRQMQFAVTEIVLEVVAPGFQDVERLVLDLPPGATAAGEFGDVVPTDLQVGDEAVAISHFSTVIADPDAQPVDRHRLLIAAQRHAGEPSIAAGDPFLAVPDAIDPFVEDDAGAEFFNRLV